MSLVIIPVSAQWLDAQGVVLIRDTGRLLGPWHLSECVKTNKQNKNKTITITITTTKTMTTTAKAIEIAIAIAITITIRRGFWTNLYHIKRTSVEYTSLFYVNKANLADGHSHKSLNVHDGALAKLGPVI